MRVGCKSKYGLLRSEIDAAAERFFLDRIGMADANGCIPWLGAKTKKGYGTIRRLSRNRGSTAHRVAWVLENGDLAPESCVLHRCDNPSCVNADHLFLGSPKDNTRDMVSKGRHFWRHALPWQKLNVVDVERIRDLRRLGHTQQEVADWIGVSRPLISLIEHGKVQHALSLMESRH